MRRAVGRYLVLDRLASGGMGTVHLGRLTGEGGFSRWVAIKVLHQQFARDPAFRDMFLDEARIVSHIRHANVVSTLDVIEDDGELFLIMDYVDGLPLSKVMTTVFQQGETIPIDVAIAIACDGLEGLHAAHEARSDSGEPYRIVHRDVSPQNIMLGRDGVARILDFGVAQAAGRSHETQPGEVKGKPAYMAPEQALGLGVDARSDVYAASIVLWELLAGERLFAGSTFAEALLRQMQMQPDPPSTRRPEVSPELDAVVLRGLAKDPSSRFESAIEMARALERAARRGHRADVARFVQERAAGFFEERALLLARRGADEVSTAPAAAPEPTPEGASMTTAVVGPRPPERVKTFVDRAPTRRRLSSASTWHRRFAMLGLAAGGILALAARALLWPVPRVTAPLPHEPAMALAGQATPPPKPVGPTASAQTTGTPAPSVVTSAPPLVPTIERRTEPRPVVLATSPRASPPASPAVAAPPCCAGSIHLRFSGCTNNCPD